MWDEMARRFEDAKLDMMHQPIIIAVSSYRVSKYRGIYSLQNLYVKKKDITTKTSTIIVDYLLSAKPTTYYYLNPNIPEAEQSRAE